MTRVLINVNRIIYFEILWNYFTLLTLLLTLCGLASQKTHRGSPELGRSVNEEAHPSFPYLKHSLKALMLQTPTAR